MNLYRLRRKDITLGATRPRYMFVAARSEENARRLAQNHEQPMLNATDTEQVVCVLIERAEHGATREHVVADFRMGAAIPPPAHWMIGEIESDS